MKEVVVVIGPGQIGQAIDGRYLLLADAREENTRAAAEVLGNAGFEVDVATVDISSGTGFGENRIELSCTAIGWGSRPGAELAVRQAPTGGRCLRARP